MSDYNGWRNWETWNLYNWLSNEESSWEYWEEAAKYEDTDTLAGSLRDAMEQPIDLMVHGWHRDVVTQCLSRVDWEQLAEALRE